MKIITGNTALRQCIPNTFATVDGETTWYDKLYPFLEQAEDWLATNITSQQVIDSLYQVPETVPLKRLAAKAITAHALMAAIPSIDLVLTPNGFGIVNTGNIAPASRDRVERLIASIENERDTAIESMLLKLPTVEGWLQTDQGRFFASTLFPNLSLCRRLAVRQHLWEEYNALRSRLIKIENTLAKTYFSQEQMAVFREKSIHLLTDCHPQMLHVIRALQSCELMLVTDMEVHCQSFYDLLNIIRQHPETFPEWHNSPTAELYIPKIFENKKTSSGYWF